MNIEVRKNPPEYDHDAVYADGRRVGFVGRANGRVGLERCPVCGEENYALSVLSGKCCWCGFDLKSRYDADKIVGSV